MLNALCFLGRARGYAEELEAKLREAEREAEVAKTDTLEERAERQVKRLAMCLGICSLRVLLSY